MPHEAFAMNYSVYSFKENGMDKTIILSYDPGKAIVDVQLTYTTELLNNVHTITCHVAAPFPLWLQTRKFELLSSLENKKYTPLFNEINHGRNLDTTLFIDLAYNSIMKMEKLTIVATAAA